MRAATASAREPRGERTLMGIGPEFIRREVIADGVSGTLDGVPQERMDRTPSSPIVVEPQAVLPSPTVRMAVPAPARTVQLSLAPGARIDSEPPPPAGTPSRRLDSLISARFFQEGEQQEANNWEDSPLVNEPFPDEEPPKFSSFDRVPHRRGPLLVTTFLLGTGLVIGLAVEGASAGAARSWLAAEAGPRAVEAWHRAKSGLAMRLTPESTNSSAQAMAAPAMATGAPALAPATPAAAPDAPAAPSAAVAATVPAGSQPATAGAESASAEDLWAPLLAAPPAPRSSGKLITSRPKPAELWHHSDARTRPTVALAPSGDAPPRGSDERLAAAPSTEPGSAEPGENGSRAEPRHGLVWSPAKQQLVPVVPAAAEMPAQGAQPESVNAEDGVAGTGSDKDVLPLDDSAHATY